MGDPECFGPMMIAETFAIIDIIIWKFSFVDSLGRGVQVFNDWRSPKLW
jgi:hypothetical protein